MSLVKVDNTTFVRDINSMGLSNLDRKGKEEYIQKTKEAKQKREEIEVMKSEIQEIKTHISEIKQLLLDILQTNK